MPVYKLNLLLVTGPTLVALADPSSVLLDPHSNQIWLWPKFLIVPCHTTHGRDYKFGQCVTGHTLGRID